MRAIKTLDDAQVAIRELYGLLDKLNSKDIDMSKRRVVNASPSRNPYDYVVRKELTDRLGDTVVDKTGTTISGGEDEYAVVFANSGVPKVGNPSAPAYVIKRRSSLQVINLVAYSPPSAGKTAIFNLYYDGTQINTDPIEITWEYVAGDLVTVTDFAYTDTYEIDKLITLECVQANRITNVTVELYYKEVV